MAETGADQAGAARAGGSRGAAAWDFAVRLYGRPGVREACLDLQDRLGIDVVAILALVHRAAEGGGGIGPDSLRQALERAEPWRRAAVLPLRAVRRALKNWQFPDPAMAPDAEAAREAVAQAELQAERAELGALAHDLAGSGRAAVAGGDPRARLGAAAKFLAVYWQVLGLEAEPQDRQALTAVLAAAFPEAADHAGASAEAAFRP
jgi:uncharacterized protein (TIGR02444 family)